MTAGAALRATLICGAVLVVLTGLRLYTITQVPLTGDEAYYWRWSQHVALGYYDHPPLIAWAIALMTGLAGQSLFAIRAAGPLLAVVSAAFVYRLARDVSGRERTGAVAAILFLVAPLSAIGSMAAAPDVVMMPAWAATVSFLYRALFAGSTRAWWIAGLTLGLGILGKLIALFLIPSLFAYLLLSRDHRPWLRRWEPYWFVLIGLLVASPFLMWNAAHGWETFGYQFTLRLAVREPGQALLDPRSFVDFVAYQFLALSPIVCVLVLVALARLVRHGWRGESRHIFLASFSLPVLLFFAAVSFRTRGGEHWPFAGYIPALAAVALLHERGGRAYRAWLAAGAALSGAMAILLFVLLLQPRLFFALASGGLDYHGINKGQPVNTSELAELFGYEALGHRVAGVVEEMRGAQTPFVITDSYALSSVIAFYSGLDTHVARGSILGREYRRWDDFDTLLGGDAVYVDLAPLGARADIENLLRQAFERVESEPLFVTYKDQQAIRPFYLVRCYGFRLNVLQ